MSMAKEYHVHFHSLVGVKYLPSVQEHFIHCARIFSIYFLQISQVESDLNHLPPLGFRMVRHDLNKKIWKLTSVGSIVVVRHLSEARLESAS